MKKKSWNSLYILKQKNETVLNENSHVLRRWKW